METYRLCPFKGVFCVCLAVLLIGVVIPFSPIPACAQLYDEEDLLNEINAMLAGYDFGGVKARAYSVQNGFGVEYYRGSKTLRVELVAVDTNRNGRIDPSEEQYTVRYGGKTASSSYDFNNYNPSDPAFALLIEGMMDLFGLGGGFGSLGGGGATQSGSSVSTLNSAFNEAILPVVEPKSAEETKGSGAEEKKKGTTWRYNAITTDLEYERVKTGGASDNAVGFLASYDARREKVSAGFRATYARAMDAKINAFSGATYLKFPIGDRLSFGGVVNVSGVSSGGESATAYSGGPFFAIVNRGEKGTVSFGALHQYSRFEGASSNILLYGTTFGLYVGKNGALNINVMRMSNAKDFDESFTVLGATYSWLASPNFSLTLGYKTLLEIDGYQSHKFTIGMTRTFF